jgi:hypothetical protein
VLDAGKVRRWQTQKKTSLAVIAGASFLLAVCSILRFVPAINDRLSGPPEYMRWITDRAARTVAARVGDVFPVVVIRDETHDCERIANASIQDTYDIYYVFFYSETTGSFCCVTYANAAAAVTRTPPLILTPKTGRNYGRRFTNSIAVVPAGHFSLRFPASYLSLLHWRRTVDPSDQALAGNALLHRSFAPSASLSSMDISLNFSDLRAAVGQRHRTVNGVLTSLGAFSALLILLAASTIGILYWRFRKECGPYYPGLRLITFLRDDLAIISEHARKNYLHSQEAGLEELRAANVLNRATEAAKHRLESLLDVLEDEPQRGRVRESLAEGDLNNMTRLLHELESHLGHRTPEDRLASLLETLKEFCSNEEFEAFRMEAFEILHRLGFRNARPFVVRTHDELRERAKLREKEELEGQTGKSGAPE